MCIPIRRTSCRSGEDAIRSWAARWVEALLELQPDGSRSARRESESLARQVADHARDRLTPADCALSQAQFVIARAYGFASWPKLAAWYDQREVIAFLLDHGVDVGARAPKEGQTALHLAAYLGNPGLAKLLLKRRAPVNVTDAVYGTPPLVWALHAWLVEGRANEGAYRTVLRMLVDAGAEVRPDWIADERLRADQELHAALAARAGGAADPG